VSSFDSDIASLTHDDILNLIENYDHALGEESKRQAMRLAIERKVIIAAYEDPKVYMQLRYGLHCPDPHKVLYPHQVAVVEDLKIQKSYWLTAPRGFVKTSTVSDYVEWSIGHHPTTRGKIVAANLKGASDQLSLISYHVLYDPLFHAVFPDIEPDFARGVNKTNLNLKVPREMLDRRNSTLEAWGYKGSPERGRVDLLWFDDVCTKKNSIEEPKERENIKESLSVTWFPLREGPDTRRIWTCTLYHTEDASHMLMKRPGWFKRHMRVTRDFEMLEDVREDRKYPLPETRWNPIKRKWEEWWTKDNLVSLYQEDAEEFRVAYWIESVDASTDTTKFKRTWFYGDPEKEDDYGAVRFGFSPEHDVYAPSLVVFGVDLAFGSRPDAKNTAISVVGLTEEHKRILLEVTYGRGWDTVEKIQQIATLAEYYQPDLIVVEDNAAQKVLVDILQEMTSFDYDVEPFTTDIHKDSKIKLLAREFRDKKWIIPFESRAEHPEYGQCNCGRCLTMREMMNYPEYRTSDCMMATLFAREGMKMIGSLDREGTVFAETDINSLLI